MVRVAVLSSCESVPWVPIVAGLLEGMRAVPGVVAQAVPIAATPDLHLAELEAMRPDLALFPCHRGEWKGIGPYLELVKRLGCKTAAVTFDDPYDLETGLAMAAELGTVFTPEVLAVDVYRRRGYRAFHLLPTVATGMHFPMREPVETALDVFHVGGNHWRPRAAILPPIRDWCRRNGRRYGEVAGRHRWIVGKALTRAVWQSRVVLEIPRFDLPTRTNPYQIPCTYTSPRVYLVAACAGLPIIIGPREDLADTFPEAAPLVAGNVAEALELLDGWCGAREEARWLRGSMLAARFRNDHHPKRRAAQILAQMELAESVTDRHPVGRPCVPAGDAG